jgi:hypothetical protein
VVCALGALFLFSFHDLASRTVALLLTFLAGAAAWAVEWPRTQSRSHLFNAAPGYWIPLVFALCGGIGFFLPEEARWRIAWFFVVLLRRLATH